MEYFGVKGISGGRLRYLTLKGGEHIRRSESRVGLTSPTNLVTGRIEVRLMSRESLLEAREEGRRRKEELCQEDTGVNRILFKIGSLLTLASLLQVYFVIPSWTRQELYLC